MSTPGLSLPFLIDEDELDKAPRPLVIDQSEVSTPRHSLPSNINEDESGKGPNSGEHHNLEVERSPHPKANEVTLLEKLDPRIKQALGEFSKMFNFNSSHVYQVFAHHGYDLLKTQSVLRSNDQFIRYMLDDGLID